MGAFSGRRIGCPGGWYTSRPGPREESRLRAWRFAAGPAPEEAGLRGRAKPGIWDRRPGWCRRPPMAAVVAVSCGSTRMPGFFWHACQPRRWERSQAGVSGVRAVGTPAGPGRAKNPGFALGDSQPGPHRKKPGFGGGQSPAFGTGGPDGVEDRQWQRSLRCRAAAPECRDFSCTPVSRGDGSVLRQAYRVSGRLVHQPARASRRIPASRLAIRSRARDGRSRASGDGKARHLGPAARMVSKTANGSGHCGVVRQHRNAGIFLARLSAAAMGSFSGRRIGSPAVGTPAGRAARRIAASRLAIRGRARHGRSRASGDGKARHLGPAARMV